MPDIARNKVIYGGQVLIDLTNDTVTAADVLAGVSFHLPDGTIATGTCTYDADTSDADAVVAEVLAGKTFYKGGQKLTGTMPNRGSQTGVISTKNGSVTILNGYHDGSGAISIDPIEVAKLIEGNIKAGITILGVTGTYAGETVVASCSYRRIGAYVGYRFGLYQPGQRGCDQLHGDSEQRRGLHGHNRRRSALIDNDSERRGDRCLM